ncbi:MAG: endonuclease Q family protein [Patescibacteria group bacterium]|nr:endonuclease Q family protein [Patescibacteria group bacterium]MDD5490962.1 endonuclease Q family protein [Patescibacteria group bacterium]
MQYIADLHIHSKYSRACSKELEAPMIEKWCKKKGVAIIATSDFTHPAWFKHLRENLEDEGNGLYVLKGSDGKVKFFCATEISCIYSQGGQTRRLHIVVFAPSLGVVEKINKALEARGCNIKSDGRPIIGLSAKELAKMVLDIDPACMVIPAHAWTPWFAVFGSKSGFDSPEECFEELTPQIFAIETGLSSDPAMNWRCSMLDNITLISNSDAHSPSNIAREANVFDLAEPSYKNICEAIKSHDPKKFLYTIEFYPEEGMYHFDGHRACGVSFAPEETKKRRNLCPECGKELTIGVLHRVDNLADQTTEKGQKGKIPFKRLVGLDDVISEALNVKGKKSKAVLAEYESLIAKGGSEFNVLLNLNYDELAKITLPMVVEGIRRNREGRVQIKPGFDGQYGEVTLFSDKEKCLAEQKKLF